MKRSLGIMLVFGLMAGVLAALPARAATAIPDVVQVEDPTGDANFLNDQDNVTPAGHPLGDEVVPVPAPAPQDAGSASDFQKIWFSHTATDVSVHILTERALPATTSIYFRVASNPGEGSTGSDIRGCLNFRAVIGGVEPNSGQRISTYNGPDFAEFEDVCNGDGAVEAKLHFEALSEDATAQGITTITVDRTKSPLFADGGTLTGAYGISRIVAGGEELKGNPADPTLYFASFAQSDNTKRGTDYSIAAPGSVVGEPTTPNPPGKSNPPGKKKGCKKGKGEKKGCKKNKPKPPVPTPPPADECAAFTPAESGKDAPVTVVKADATAEKPVEVELVTEPGLGTGTGLPTDAATTAGFTHAYYNVQMDAPAGSGLYVRFEGFEHGEDYDMYLYNPDGTEAAHAAGFNAAPVLVFDGTGSGGHSEETAEQIDGVATNDCQGYTIDVVTASGLGGTHTLKFWVGDATYTAGGAALYDAAASLL